MAADLVEAADEILEGDLFHIVDWLERARGTEWVQQQVARLVMASPLRPTPQLQALVRLPSRRIATTNYDDSIELAAQAVGLESVSFDVTRIDEALRQPPDGCIHVLHLHGMASEPGSIVLSTETYSRARDDDHLRFGLEQLCVQWNLVFLGFSLAEREKHFWRDLIWSADVFPGSGPHYLVLPESEVAHERFERLTKTRVQAVSYLEPGESHEGVRRVVQVLGASAAVAEAEFLTRVSSSEIDAYFLPLSMMEQDDAPSEGSLEWELFAEEMPTVSLDDMELFSRVLLVGPPGSGKTQTLYQIGQRAPQLSIYRRLGGMEPSRSSNGAGETFVRWMEGGRALRENVPRLTYPLLRDASYVFLLDGLDEVSQPLRDDIFQTIVWTAQLFPQHRFVVASRPLPNFEKDVEFGSIQLLLSEQWMLRYFNSRALSDDQVSTLIEDAPSLRELLKIPLFAATAAESLISGEELPSTPLGLVMRFADRGLSLEHPKIGLSPEDIRAWLNDLALAMEAQNAVSVQLPELIEGPLPKSSSEAAPELIDRITVRALLSEAGSEVRFPANVIQEGRAAAALLGHPVGLDLLEEFALFEFEGEKGIRGSWANTIELVLADAPPAWRDKVSQYDPLVVALTTSRNAPRSEREAAVLKVWEWYYAARIWIPRDRPSGRLLDELSVVARLMHDGVPETFLRKLEGGLADQEPTVRGNAIYVLEALGKTEVLEPHLEVLVADPDAVVRRHAASSARHLACANIFPALIEQLRDEKDSLARETLFGAAVALAPPDEIEALLEGASNDTSFSAFSALDARWNREEQLEWLVRSKSVSEEWVRYIARGEGWSANEIRLLARIVLRQARGGHVDRILRQALTTSPVIAIEEMLNEQTSRIEAYETRFLMDLVSPAELEAMVPNIDSDLGRSALQEYLEWQKKPHTPSPTPPKQPAPLPPLAECIQSHAFEDLLRRRELPLDETDGLSSEDRARLAKWVAEAVHSILSPGTFKRHFDASTRQFSLRLWHVLELGARFRSPISYGRWMRLVKSRLRPGDTGEWLRESFRPSWSPLLIAATLRLTDQVIAHLAEVLPRPWPAALTPLLGPVMFQKSNDDYAKRVATEELANRGLRRALRRLARSSEDGRILEALVQAGDCEAESRLVLEVENDIELIPDLPFGTENHWFKWIRCQSSFDPLTRIFRELFGRSGRDSQLHLVTEALNSLDEASAMRFYRDLSGDSSLQGSGFVWYRMRDLFHLMAEKEANSRLPKSLVETIGKIQGPNNHPR